MRKAAVFAILLVFLIGVPVTHMQDDDAEAASLPVIIRNTETILLSSPTTEQDYRISVALPESYAISDRTYPAVYVLDPVLMFQTTTEFVRTMAWAHELPELIVVGVGYPTDDMGAIERLRALDFQVHTEAFFTFLTDELFPLIESSYRADATDRGLIGFSYGGAFVYHVLANNPEQFKHYIAIDIPAGEFSQRVMQNDPAYWSRFADLDVKLFMAMANEETLSGTLQERNYPGLEVTGLALGGVTHPEALYFSLARGLLAIYGLW